MRNMPVPETFITHVGDVMKYIRDYWEIILGGLATLWGGVKLMKQNWLRGYATKEEMEACHDKLHHQIARNREINTKEHNELRDIIIDRLSK